MGNDNKITSICFDYFGQKIYKSESVLNEDQFGQKIISNLNESKSNLQNEVISKDFSTTEEKPTFTEEKVEETDNIKELNNSVVIENKLDEEISIKKEESNDVPENIDKIDLENFDQNELSDKKNDKNLESNKNIEIKEVVEETSDKIIDEKKEEFLKENDDELLLIKDDVSLEINESTIEEPDIEIMEINELVEIDENDILLEEEIIKNNIKETTALKEKEIPKETSPQLSEIEKKLLNENVEEEFDKISKNNIKDSLLIKEETNPTQEDLKIEKNNAEPLLLENTEKEVKIEETVLPYKLSGNISEGKEFLKQIEDDNSVFVLEEKFDEDETNNSNQKDNNIILDQETDIIEVEKEEGTSIKKEKVPSKTIKEIKEVEENHKDIAVKKEEEPPIFLRGGIGEEAEKPSVYSLAGEFTKNKKNKSFLFYTIVFTFIILLGAGTYLFTEKIKKDTTLKINFSDFEDLNLKELIDNAEEAQRIAAQAEASLNKLQSEMANIDSKINDIKSAAEQRIKAIENQKLSNAKKSKLIKDIEAKYAAQLKNAQEERKRKEAERKKLALAKLNAENVKKLADKEAEKKIKGLEESLQKKYSDAQKKYDVDKAKMKEELLGGQKRFKEKEADYKNKITQLQSENKSLLLSINSNKEETKGLRKYYDNKIKKLKREYFFS